MLLEKFLKTFHKPFALKVSQNIFIKTGSWAQPHALKIKREPGSTVCLKIPRELGSTDRLKSKREPGLNRLL